MTEIFRGLVERAVEQDGVFAVTMIITMADGSMVTVQAQACAPWSGYAPADSEEALPVRIAKAGR